MQSFYKGGGRFSKKSLKKVDDMTEEEKLYLSEIKRQNPYGIITMLMGLISFLFGPIFVVIPICTIFFGVITLRTFNKITEDNPWTFYIGLALAFYGLILYFTSGPHNVII